ncbi:MAG: VOC family protein [Acidimicrobiia bacterium]|nr:VOC family protein [Acidimicrobiia bacterium]
MMQVNPYLNFSGNCEEAFEFYKSVFGGELYISRFSEIPSDDSAPQIDGNLIMHVSMPIGDGQVLMGSDRPDVMGATTAGDNVMVIVSPDRTDDAKRIFDALSDGGTVTMQFERTFWGADFGMLTDKFDINWMVNFDANQGS